MRSADQGQIQFRSNPLQIHTSLLGTVTLSNIFRWISLHSASEKGMHILLPHQSLTLLLRATITKEVRNNI